MDISGNDMIQLTLILCFMFYTLLYCARNMSEACWSFVVFIKNNK